MCKHCHGEIIKYIFFSVCGVGGKHCHGEIQVYIFLQGGGGGWGEEPTWKVRNPHMETKTEIYLDRNEIYCLPVYIPYSHHLFSCYRPPFNISTGN